MFFDEYGRLVEGGGFDVVMGNPPWGASLVEAERQYCVVEFPVVSTKTKDSYLYFVMQVLRELRVAGRLGLIIPNTWLLINYAQDFRRALLALDIIEIVDHGDGVFGEATVESATLLLVNRESLLSYCHAVRLKRGKLVSEHQADKAFWLEDNYHRILLDVDVRKVAILSHLKTNSDTFADACSIIWGIKPYQVGYGIPPQTQEMVDARVYHSNTKRGPQWKPLAVGSDVDRYTLSFRDDQFIKYGEWLMYPSDEKQMLGPKILMRQTSHILRACYDSTGLYCQNSVFIIHSKAVDLHFLLALLNSGLLSFAYTLRNPQADKVFPEIKPSVIQQLPIRRISFATPAETRAALTAEAQGLAAAAVTTGDFTAVLAFVAAQLAAQPERSDVIHDLLAGLAEQMIAMNKQKGDEMRGFLVWLERETGARIKDLTGRSQLRNYPGNYQKGETPLAFDDLLAILRKNARKLTADPAARKFQESLNKEYEASLAVLLPLKARLAASDRLIDQVVYRLYGLTQEEIAIVEGKESR